MEKLVTIESGMAFVTSNQVADNFKKLHRTIHDKIKDLIKSQPEFGSANYNITTYTTRQNKTHSCFEMTRDGFCMIAMSLIGREAEEWKIKYINAFNKMELALKSDSLTMQCFNELVKKAESDKAVASACGGELARYKKVKKQNQLEIDNAIKQVQLDLGFTK